MHQRFDRDRFAIADGLHASSCQLSVGSKIRFATYPMKDYPSFPGDSQVLGVLLVYCFLERVETEIDSSLTL